MRFNIKKLQAAGLEVIVGKDNIEIHAPPVPEAVWLEARKNIEGLVKDPGLRDYVLGIYLTALHRARVLELAD